ncbi:MAG TPA: hypothetical protein VFC16_14945 [Nakamurella sp.]|nr:hypothetical protein [Nakamurella sp.]
MGERPAVVQQLHLVAEAPVRDLLPDGGSPRGEASGVLAMGDHLLVIFDDSTVIGVIETDLGTVDGNHTVRPDPLTAGGRHAGRGYEDIARDMATGHLYLLVEAVRRGDRFMARVEEIDGDYRRHSEAWLDFALEEENKGIEGLTCAQRDGQVFLLALCEGNRCRGGDAGEQPGGGRMQLFRPDQHACPHAGTIDLPPQLWFIDYSSLAVHGDRIAVISQRSSALWVGSFTPGTWDLVDAGNSYEFPRDPDGHTIYGTVEGVSWLDDDHVVVVSDRADRSEPRWRTKHRSVHIFAIPAAGPDPGPIS